LRFGVEWALFLSDSRSRCVMLFEDWFPGDSRFMIVEEIHQRDTWNDTLRALPCAHVLQSWEWGEFKRATTGWQPTGWPSGGMRPERSWLWPRC